MEEELFGEVEGDNYSLQRLISDLFTILFSLKSDSNFEDDVLSRKFLFLFREPERINFCL